MANLNDDTWFKCQRKMRYHNKKIAKRVAKRWEKADGDAMSVYRCNYCGGWHIGHTFPAQAAARKLERARAEAERQAEGDLVS